MFVIVSSDFAPKGA